MIHTAKFYIDLTKEEAFTIEKNVGVLLEQLPTKVNKRFYGITAWILNQYGMRLNFIIDFKKMLKKTDVQEEDYETIEKIISDFIEFLFHDQTYVEKIVMTRIDFCYDVVMPEAARDFMFYIYRKATSKYKHQKKYDKYNRTIYFNSQSLQCCCYDKQEEAESKRGFVEEFERDVLRYEVRLGNKHLKYQKYRNGKNKNLKLYFKEDNFKRYMEQYFIEILFPGDYFKINKAKLIVEKSGFTKTEKLKVLEFLSYVSNYGVDSARKKYTKYFFKKRLMQLESLWINPILIPKNRKDIGSFLQNPLTLTSKKLIERVEPPK